MEFSMISSCLGWETARVEGGREGKNFLKISKCFSFSSRPSDRSSSEPSCPAADPRDDRPQWAHRLHHWQRRVQSSWDQVRLHRHHLKPHTIIADNSPERWSGSPTAMTETPPPTWTEPSPSRGTRSPWLWPSIWSTWGRWWCERTWSVCTRHDIRNLFVLRSHIITKTSLAEGRITSPSPCWCSPAEGWSAIILPSNAARKLNLYSNQVWIINI